MASESVFGIPAVTEKDLLDYSISTLAWVGDAVFELYIRTRLSAEHKVASGPLHQKAARFVSARGQATLADKLAAGRDPFPLEEKEQNLLKRARNYHASSMSRHADPADYRKATAIEALVGWLWLGGKEERAIALIRHLLIPTADEDPS